MLPLGPWDLGTHQCIEGSDGEPGAAAVDAFDISITLAPLLMGRSEKICRGSTSTPPPPAPSILELTYRGEGRWGGAAGAGDLA